MEIDFRLTPGLVSISKPFFRKLSVRIYSYFKKQGRKQFGLNRISLSSSRSYLEICFQCPLQIVF